MTHGHHKLNHNVTDISLECPDMMIAPSVLVYPLPPRPVPSDDILSELILSITDYDRGDDSGAVGNNELKLLIIAERTHQSFVSANASNTRSTTAEWFPQNDAVPRPTMNKTLGSFSGCTVVIATKRIVNVGKESATEGGALRLPVQEDASPVLLDMYTSGALRPPATAVSYTHLTLPTICSV